MYREIIHKYLYKTLGHIMEECHHEYKVYMNMSKRRGDIHISMMIIMNFIIIMLTWAMGGIVISFACSCFGFCSTCDGSASLGRSLISLANWPTCSSNFDRLLLNVLLKGVGIFWRLCYPWFKVVITKSVLCTKVATISFKLGFFSFWACGWLDIP